MSRFESLSEALRLIRWRVQGRIGDVLQAIDRATGSVLERRILCGTLDRLGGDGVVAFLNEMPPQDLEREINGHVQWMEEHAVAGAIDRARELVAPQPIDKLLKRVMARLGPGGRLTLEPLPDALPLTPHVGVSWRRDYDGGLSDERRLDNEWGLELALKAVLRWEDAADAEDAAAARVARPCRGGAEGSRDRCIVHGGLTIDWFSRRCGGG